jgi:hypothetical protein
MPIPKFSKRGASRGHAKLVRKISDAVSIPEGTTVKAPIWPIGPNFTAEDKQEMKATQLRTTGAPELLVLREPLRVLAAGRLDRDAIVSGGTA